MLSSGSDDRRDRVRSSITAEPNTSSAYRTGDKVQVRILERPTNSTLIVLWSDPGRCFYGHQCWRATKARLSFDRATESFQHGQRTAIIIGNKGSENRGRFRRTRVLCKQVNRPWGFEAVLPDRVSLYRGAPT
ncbi:DUF3331 domain-containing protein [Paraburkholderia sp. LEh10]|uniref:DUF3331 domain-containing protein n=1 Tax=Paraburkholderia sp. LEh10 TaxID=2821353 RepID=UPI001AE2ED01|nr:DUF3331 domain-containing protein [Paraburkholderia sp. LEh10]MBP0595626.1 DUF3331 domain-containing protein [Paraburkholderia sp. LEh10]